MQICVVGDFCQNLDEGYKNTSHYLAAGLEGRHTVTRLNVKRLGRPSFWRRFSRADPEIIHVVAQPTDRSLVLTHLLRRLRPRARTVLSALRGEAYFGAGRRAARRRRLLCAVPPDLVLTQSGTAENLFRDAGCRAAGLPNGVDTERFKPVDAEQKCWLRAKYDLAVDRPVVLHVGHLRRERNLEALAPLVEAGKQVVVAGSLYMGKDAELAGRLERAGIHLLPGYQPHVEELYQLADCYVFPTAPGDSISMPLSVLEAMACNLPIVTTRFAALEHHFVSGHGFVYVDGQAEVPARVEETLQNAGSSMTRALVRDLSWTAVVDRLQSYYAGLVTT